MRVFVLTIKDGLRQFWDGLREWSGDAAYEKYVECARKGGAQAALSETDFYVEQLNRRYSRPNRCC